MSKKIPPSMDEWLREAKADEKAARCGMFLVHNGVVRESAKEMVRAGKADAPAVTGMNFSYDAGKVDAAVADALTMPGIFLVKVWLNEGLLTVGDDIMFVLVGGDIRPHVIDALQSLVGEIKNHCVLEEEIY